MTFETIELDVDGAVATITLNRPERINAIDPQLRDDLDAVLHRFRYDSSVRALRIRAAGRHFCSGYDMSSGASVYATDAAAPSAAPTGSAETPLAELPDAPLVADRARLRDSVERWLRMWDYPKPVIAQVHGSCLAGGLDLIGACDLVVAADDARFGHPAARGLGIPPTLGMLPMKIGLSATKSMLFTGDLISAVRAQTLGLVDEIVAPDELDARVLEYCRRVALNSADVLALHKGIVNRWAEAMGIRDAVLAGADFDAMFHVTSACQEFGAVVGRHGLRAALDWRDGPYR